MAYYYDHVRKDNAVELNQCRHNHMGMDVLYRSHPNFTPKYVKKEYIGGCRNTLKYCEDCMVTDFDKIYSVHYTMCRKPWQCMAKAEIGGCKGQCLDPKIVNQEHCHEVVREWHKLRAEVEQELFKLTGDETILDGQKGTYENDIFLGHCKDDGNDGYLLMSGKDESYLRLNDLYK